MNFYLVRWNGCPYIWSVNEQQPPLKMNAPTNTYDSEVRRLRGHFANCDGYRKVCETHSGLLRLEFTYLRAMQKPLIVRMDVSMDQIEEAENKA